MYSGIRITSLIVGLCNVHLMLACWCTTPAQAQHLHWHGCGPLLPDYAYDWYGVEVSAVWVTPVVPIWVAPAVGVSPFDPLAATIPRRPLGPALPMQTENFARNDVIATVKGRAGNPLVEPGALSDPGPISDLDEIRHRVTVLKRSTPQGRIRADRLIAAGDASFRKQSYARAVAQYRDAIARAPDYAEGHFRLAHAYVATRRFNLALKSAMTALELAGTARRDGFSLDELYQGNRFAREQHDAQLFDAASREPTDGGLQFLIGFTLHYDLQPLKAREYFRKANRFAGAHQAYLRHFVAIVPVAEPANLAADAN